MPWLQDKDAVLAVPDAQQLSPTKAIAAAKHRPRINKQLHWQWTGVQGEGEGARCSNQDALHIHFTVNIVKLQGQGFCIPHSQSGLRPCCHPSPWLQIPSKQPASQTGHRHTVLWCWGGGSGPNTGWGKAASSKIFTHCNTAPSAAHSNACSGNDVGIKSRRGEGL